jgi:hypothetical protein
MYNFIPNMVFGGSPKIKIKNIQGERAWEKFMNFVIVMALRQIT